jgi:rod shape-determining protein MreC
MVVLLCLTLVALDAAGDGSMLHPVRSFTRDTFAAGGSQLSKLWPFDDGDNVKQLQARNADLQTQLDQANGQLSTTADAQRELAELHRLLDLPTIDNATKVVAEVVAFGTSNFDATIEIGKGSKDGIHAGMPVVTGAGLVGRVIQTSDDRSTVLLITDTTANVSIRYSTAGDIGVAAGQGVGRNLRGDLVSLDSGIAVGEVAVTSGTDGSLYPAGIPVATVKSVNVGPRDLRKDVELKPVVDFGKLDNVAVVQWTS